MSVQIDQHLIIWPIAIKGIWRKQCGQIAFTVAVQISFHNYFARKIRTSHWKLESTKTESSFTFLHLKILKRSPDLVFVQYFPTIIFYFTCPQYLFYCSASLSAALVRVMHRASSSSEEKQEKWHLDLLILSVASPLIPITWYLQTLSLPEINMLCGVWQCLGPVGHRDIVLIGVTLGHFRPMRDQGWSARTNQKPLPTICRSHPRCQSSHGEYCPLLRMPTFGVMFLLDTEMCISNWDWLHLISLRL